MRAIEKMDAFGMKPLAEATKSNLVTIYRWRRALIDGRGIADPKKKKLIDATAAAAEPITWSDFLPDQADAA